MRPPGRATRLFESCIKALTRANTFESHKVCDAKLRRMRHDRMMSPYTPIGLVALGGVIVLAVIGVVIYHRVSRQLTELRDAERRRATALDMIAEYEYAQLTAGGGPVSHRRRKRRRHLRLLPPITATTCALWAWQRAEPVMAGLAAAALAGGLIPPAPTVELGPFAAPPPGREAAPAPPRQPSAVDTPKPAPPVPAARGPAAVRPQATVSAAPAASPRGSSPHQPSAGKPSPTVEASECVRLAGLAGVAACPTLPAVS